MGTRREAYEKIIHSNLIMSNGKSASGALESKLFMVNVNAKVYIGNFKFVDEFLHRLPLLRQPQGVKMSLMS
jgi:hypothetical protein